MTCYQMGQVRKLLAHGFGVRDVARLQTLTEREVKDYAAQAGLKVPKERVRTKGKR